MIAQLFKERLGPWTRIADFCAESWRTLGHRTARLRWLQLPLVV